MVTKTDFGQREVAAGKSVLLELIHILGEFRDSIVVVGGSVPPLLYPDSAAEYVGTLDVDLALNHSNISDKTYQTIRRLLLNRGYREHDKQPFIFYRDILTAGGSAITVQIDFLAGEYKGSGKSHRTQKIQDIRARKARGSDLVFKQFKEVEIEGNLPAGGKDKVRCRISALVPFIIMKGMALADRLKEKDAYDIYYCLTHHPGGLDDAAEEFRPFVKNKLVVEGLQKIAGKFGSPEHTGPAHIADFQEITDAEERYIIRRDAYERVHYLLQKLGII